MDEDPASASAGRASASRMGLERRASSARVTWGGVGSGRARAWRSARVVGAASAAATGPADRTTATATLPNARATRRPGWAPRSAGASGLRSTSWVRGGATRRPGVDGPSAWTRRWSRPVVRRARRATRAVAESGPEGVAGEIRTAIRVDDAGAHPYHPATQRPCRRIAVRPVPRRRTAVDPSPATDAQRAHASPPPRHSEPGGGRRTSRSSA